LSKDEVEKMRQDAEAHAEEDKKKRELVDARNRAEQLAFETEKQLAEHGEKVPADVRSEIESAVGRVKETAKGDDLDAITKAGESLMQSAQKLGEVIYKQAAESAGGTPPPDAEGAAEPQPDEDVIDAEYEVKENK
jgi:molecular chaperone DnaK